MSFFPSLVFFWRHFSIAASKKGGAPRDSRGLRWLVDHFGSSISEGFLVVDLAWHFLCLYRTKIRCDIIVRNKRRCHCLKILIVHVWNQKIFC